MMTSRIVESLTALAGEETVRIVYACESGSRAWGFPSADSDFDVRFLYLHPPDLGFTKSVASVSQIKPTAAGVVGLAAGLLGTVFYCRPDAVAG